ncbi:MAG: ABC transporter ATP-binding protein [Deltaproteobacteria bacterium]|nr:ABC transporter ATP-binding protein [Deltaproteobacteria bacterium]MBW1871216.1 ABC transporter ATP-binding protein [Deltaproteobacteria bacterium]
MIAVEGLSSNFGDFALRDIQLQVKKDSYAVILGPSGCGKTLLLRSLAGLDQPDSGKITISEKDVTDLPPEKRKVGMVFQEASLFPHYNIEDNIGYGLKAQGVPKPVRRARIAELVSILGIADILSRPVSSLSGGESQKVALARALASQPEVLLLDEPLSKVDHNTRLDLQQELRRIHNQLSLTTLHVTHSQEEARFLGDYCAVMLGGRIIQAGLKDDVMDSPVCPFVARFLGLDVSTSSFDGLECDQECLTKPGSCSLPKS